MKYLLLFTGILFGQLCVAQSVYGKWKTIDDETGEPKSIVEIYERNGKTYGKIIDLINPSSANPKCDDCEGDRKNQPIKGLEIIRDLEKDDDEYSEGTIVDPEDGKVYDCKIWIESDDPDTLYVRGYVYFFFRTQTWLRV